MSQSRLEELRRHYVLPEPSFSQKLLFLVSLYYQPLLGGNLYDEIVPGILLGRILTVEQANELKKLFPKLCLVASVADDFELNGKIFSIDMQLMSPEMWRSIGVEHHHLIATDFTADMSIEATLATLKKMHAAIEKGEWVYVHCKAGRGRSATLVLLYLLFYGTKDGELKPKLNIDNLQNLDAGMISKEDINAVYAYLQKKRSVVGLHDHNFDTINKVVKSDKKILKKPEKDEISFSQNDFKSRLNDYLHSVECKEKISQMNSFKHLKFYGYNAGKSSNRGKLIQGFLDDIYYANDAEWFIKLVNGEGPLKNLLDAKPDWFWGGGTAKKRVPLVNNFKDEIYKHVATVLNCKKEALPDLIKNVDLQDEWQQLCI